MSVPDATFTIHDMDITPSSTRLVALGAGRGPRREPVAGVAPIMRYRLLRAQPGVARAGGRQERSRRVGVRAARPAPGPAQSSASDPAA